MSEPREGISSPVDRRSVLRAGLSVAGLAAAAPVIAACSSGTSSSSSSSAAATSASAAESASETSVASAAADLGGAKGNVTFGSNASDAVPKEAYAQVFKNFTTKTGTTVAVNTVDHNTFQEQINSYLQGSPDQDFTWFAGYRMRFFADQGLATDISDVWKVIGPMFNDAFKLASTGNDGQQYFVPFYYYPWAIFYRKSVFKAAGIDPEQIKTIDDLSKAAATLKAKGMVPLAFADKDGWPAMGTFDYLNVRTNGYDFHVNLMAGKESWTDPKVKEVFANWSKYLLPISQEGSLGRTWQEAAQSLLQKKAGMYLLGMFVGQQFPEGADRDDLDFFAFPEINSAYGRDTVEAPIDGFMMSNATSNVDGGKQLLTYLGGPEAIDTYLASDPNNVAANKLADTSKYNALQKKAAQLVGEAKSITQFLDRDTRPDFASTVMIPALQSYIENPSNIDSILNNVEEQKKAIFQS